MSTVIESRPFKGDYAIPSGEEYNSHKDWTDGAMGLRLYYNNPQTPTIAEPPYERCLLFIRNDLIDPLMKEVSVVINLDQFGQGARNWSDNIKDHNPNAQDTRTIEVGILGPQQMVKKTFEYQIKWVTPVGGNVGFKENLGITPDYRIDYTNYPWKDIQVRVEPDVKAQ